MLILLCLKLKFGLIIKLISLQIIRSIFGLTSTNFFQESKHLRFYYNAINYLYVTAAFIA